jgi:hypothetical protein
MSPVKRCNHGKNYYYCKECPGPGICSHRKQKRYCRECDGNGFCEHRKQKRRCRECDGTAFCGHGTRKERCRECDGTAFCGHGKEKYKCRECDFQGYLKDLVSRRVHHALQSDKQMKTLEYLECTVEQLKQHLEQQFKEGMTWENKGKWHIDHIIPIKYKENGEEPSLEEIIKRLHYTNLQPLWASENISKGNRYVG